MERRIVVNGREYASVEAMPDGVRQAYQQALAQLADADGNGIPDVVERGGTGQVVSVQQSSITFNGRTVEVSGEMPPFLRGLVEDALSPGRSARGGPSDAFGAAAPRAAPPWAATAGEDAARHVVGSLFARARHGEPATEALDRTGRALENFMAVLLGTVAVVVLTVAVLMITSMDASSSSQGGRLYVAVAAVVVLGAIEGQAIRLAERRWGSSGIFGASSAASRRFTLLSVLALLLAAALLFGLALRGP